MITRRWQLYVDGQVPVEVANQGGVWIVTAADAVRTRKRDLRFALREVVGHLVDNDWLDRTCRQLELEASASRRKASEVVDRSGAVDHPTPAHRSRSPTRPQAPR